MMLLRRETPEHRKFIIGRAEEQHFLRHRGAVGLHDSAYLLVYTRYFLYLLNKEEMKRRSNTSWAHRGYARLA